MRVSRLLSRAFLEKLENHVYRCKLCGEEIYSDKYTEPAKSIRYHFYYKHKEIYLIAYKCMHNDEESCKILELIKNYYAGGKR
ncbi:MAG: hypothetical protein ACP5JE_06135 [Thermoplasmata archaeon]|jgi:hypothetical protein